MAEDLGSIVVVSGQRELDGGGHHERDLIWIPGHGLVVADRVTGSEGPLGLSFHLGSGLRARPSGEGEVDVTDSGTSVMRIRAHGPHTEWRIIRGETTPTQGWISTSEHVRIPADVITIADSGRSTLFVTEFMLSDPGAGRGGRESAVESVTSGDGVAALRLRAGNELWTVTIGAPGSPVRDSAASKVP
jgi:hypothetical protein